MPGVGRKMGEEPLERVEPAGGGADGDDRKVLGVGARLVLCAVR